MKINNIVINTTLVRPRIPRSVATFESGQSVLGNGDFGYNKRYNTREFSFSTYDNIDHHVFEDVVVEIDDFNYHGRVIDIEHEYTTMTLVLTKVTLLIQPFKYLLAEYNERVKIGNKDTTVGTQTGTYRALGSIYYEPIIEIYGIKESEIIIAFDDVLLKLSECPGYLKIDCRDYHLNVYDQTGQERNDLLISDFPRLVPGTTGVSMPFGLELYITGNWREL